MKARTTKSAAFLARAERLAAVADGPERARLELAVRTGLLAGGRRGAGPGALLLGALHCMTIARIELEDPETRGSVTERSIESAEPADALECIAQAYELLDKLADAVSAELDQAEAEIEATRKVRKARRAA
jgi:hypothetical protein